MNVSAGIKGSFKLTHGQTHTCTHSVGCCAECNLPKPCRARRRLQQDWVNAPSALCSKHHCKNMLPSHVLQHVSLTFCAVVAFCTPLKVHLAELGSLDSADHTIQEQYRKTTPEVSKPAVSNLHGDTEMSVNMSASTRVNVMKKMLRPQLGCGAQNL